MRLTTTAFDPGGEIPAEHTCDGRDLSPALEWASVPPAVVTFVLTVDDPDAAKGRWVHWVLFNVPANVHGLAGGLQRGHLPPGSEQGRNDFGRVGYGGPCPPPGPAHHYHFTLYALDTRLDLAAGATRAEVDAAMHGHVLAQSELVGLYQRRARGSR